MEAFLIYLIIIFQKTNLTKASLPLHLLETFHKVTDNRVLFTFRQKHIHMINRPCYRNIYKVPVYLFFSHFIPAVSDIRHGRQQKHDHREIKALCRTQGQLILPLWIKRLNQMTNLLKQFSRAISTWPSRLLKTERIQTPELTVPEVELLCISTAPTAWQSVSFSSFHSVPIQV